MSNTEAKNETENSLDGELTQIIREHLSAEAKIESKSEAMSSHIDEKYENEYERRTGLERDRDHLSDAEAVVYGLAIGATHDTKFAVPLRHQGRLELVRALSVFITPHDVASSNTDVKVRQILCAAILDDLKMLARAYFAEMKAGKSQSNCLRVMGHIKGCQYFPPNSSCSIRAYRERLAHIWGFREVWEDAIHAL